MALITNESLAKKPSIPVDAVEAWLEENPHRKAESMTGILATGVKPNPVIDNELVIKRRKAKREAEARAQSILMSKVKKVKTKGPAAMFYETLEDFERRIRNGEIVRVEDLAPHSKQTIFRMVKKLRESNLDILTITRSGVGVAWGLETAILGDK